MAIGVNGINGNDYSYTGTGSAGTVSGDSWRDLFNARMNNFQEKTSVLASVFKPTQVYKPGSYNSTPLIPPIINPPSEVTLRGPNAPYYDERLTGGPIIRPDARLYTYETAPSYIKAILDFGNSMRSNTLFAQDIEYRDVYKKLTKGLGYKGHFMDPTTEAFAKEWSGYNPVVNVSKAKEAVLGAIVYGSQSDDSEWLGSAANSEEAKIRQEVAKVLQDNPDKAALVIDGDIVLVPKSMAAGFQGANMQNQLSTQNASQRVSASANVQQELDEILGSSTIF